MADCDVKGRLDIGLVQAGQHPAGVDGLHLATNNPPTYKEQDDDQMAQFMMIRWHTFNTKQCA